MCLACDTRDCPLNKKRLDNQPKVCIIPFVRGGVAPQSEQDVTDPEKKSALTISEGRCWEAGSKGSSEGG